MTKHNENVILRPATSDDIKALYELDHKLFPPHISYDFETFIAAHLAPSAMVVVAEVGKSIAGFIIAIADWEEAGVIITIDITQECQRQGVGTKLMLVAHEGLRELGSDRVILQVAVENNSAIAFYEKLGYKTTDTIKGYYAGVEDAFTMEVALHKTGESV